MSSNDDSGVGFMGSYAASIRMGVIGMGAVVALALGIAGCGGSSSTQNSQREELEQTRTNLNRDIQKLHRVDRNLPTVSKGSGIERELRSEDAVLECDERERRQYQRSHEPTETYEWEMARDRHDPCNGGRPSPVAGRSWGQ